MELSAMGAVYLGGLKMGMWQDFDELKSLNDISVTYVPQGNDEDVTHMMKQWHKAIQSTLNY